MEEKGRIQKLNTDMSTEKKDDGSGGCEDLKRGWRLCAENELLD